MFMECISLEMSMVASIPEMATIIAYFFANQLLVINSGAPWMILLGSVRCQYGIRIKKITYGINRNVTCFISMKCLNKIIPSKKR